MDLLTAADIFTTVLRINELLSSDIFHYANRRHVLVRSAFTELLIHLRDLMSKAESHSTRISFTDDVTLTNTVKDVSDLIKFVRDALCHQHIYNHKLTTGPQVAKVSFNVAYGKGELMQINNITVQSDYDDDVCFFFGAQKIYLKRHIIRAFDEAKQKLLPLLPPSYQRIAQLM